jgi:hypothetical protein
MSLRPARSASNDYPKPYKGGKKVLMVEVFFA